MTHGANGAEKGPGIPKRQVCFNSGPAVRFFSLYWLSEKSLAFGFSFFARPPTIPQKQAIGLHLPAARTGHGKCLLQDLNTLKKSGRQSAVCNKTQKPPGACRRTEASAFYTHNSIISGDSRNGGEGNAVSLTQQSDAAVLPIHFSAGTE